MVRQKREYMMHYTLWIVVSYKFSKPGGTVNQLSLDNLSIEIFALI